MSKWILQEGLVTDEANFSAVRNGHFLGHIMGAET
jgi:hypothetical protein